MIAFLLIVVASFIGMEFFSYLIHRFGYHGIFWRIHRSHHTPRTGPFEWNDIFPLVFALISIVGIAVAVSGPGNMTLLATMIGVTAYGMVYFFIHDLYIHRRVRALRLRIPLLLRLKKAHAVHHRSGGEPYGLLFFLPGLSEDVREEDVV